MIQRSHIPKISGKRWPPEAKSVDSERGNRLRVLLSSLSVLLASSNSRTKQAAKANLAFDQHLGLTPCHSVESSLMERTPMGVRGVFAQLTRALRADGKRAHTLTILNVPS